MNMIDNATRTDFFLLDTLAYRVRLLSLSQATRIYHERAGISARASKKRLRDLERSGLLHRHLLNAHPLIDVSKPIVTWQPGDADPDFHSASIALRSRWTEAPVSTLVFIPTQKLIRHLGARGNPKPPPLGQEAHDLHVSEVFLSFARADAKVADYWFGEEFYRKDRKGQVLPDAMLLDENLSPTQVIEFGGAYDRRRVAHFHHDCAKRHLPYELW